MSWPLLISKTCLSAGLFLLGMALFPWIAAIGAPVTGIAATFGCGPAFPFHYVFYKASLVPALPAFWLSALAFFVLFAATFYRTKIPNRKGFLQQVALCLLCFVPIGAVGTILLLEGMMLLLWCVAKGMGKVKGDGEAI